jgi:hypothetical protein
MEHTVQYIKYFIPRYNFDVYRVFYVLYYKLNYCNYIST